MNITRKDFKEGTVKLRVTNLDDLWYLNQIIEPGDLVTGKTTRKMRVGEKAVKKTLLLTVQAETIEFGASGDSLRINGKVKQGPEEVPLDSYHALAIEEGNEFTLKKIQWLQYQKQKLNEATEEKRQFLICLLDREEAIFALTTRSGHEILAEIKGQVAKKAQSVETKDFHKEIIGLLESYEKRYNPPSIVLASPAFYKEDLLKKTSAELKKKIVLATCFDVSKRGIEEVMKRPELTAVLKSSRAREEQLLVDHLLEEINKEGKATYGWKEVRNSIEAISDLLITDQFIQKKKEGNTFEELDQIMKKIDSMQGKIHLLSSDHEGGKKLNGLGGIAALLRYKS